MLISIVQCIQNPSYSLYLGLIEKVVTRIQLTTIELQQKLTVIIPWSLKVNKEGYASSGLSTVAKMYAGKI